MIALAAAALVVTAAGAQWREDGKKVRGSEWRKHQGTFGVQLGFTDKPDELFATWERHTEGVEFSSIGTAYRSVPIVAVFFFTGCRPDERGQCNATVRFTLFDPKGKVVGQPQDGDLWVGKAAPGENALQLGVGNLGIVIDPGDPLGKYTVEAAEKKS